MSIQPYPYEAYEDFTSHAFKVPVYLVAEMEADDGIPWPVSGDATTLRGKR